MFITPTPARMLVIFFDESDTWGTPPVPLARAIVEKLISEGISGATVLRGLMGFGAAHQLHEAEPGGFSSDRPITIAVIDTEDALRAVLPKIAPMIEEGIVFLLDGEILHHGAGVPGA
jgi:uncharacterized protein